MTASSGGSRIVAASTSSRRNGPGAMPWGTDWMKRNPSDRRAAGSDVAATAGATGPALDGGGGGGGGGGADASGVATAGGGGGPGGGGERTAARTPPRQ